MNLLGVQVSLVRDPSARIRWTRRLGALAIANIAVISGGIAYANWSTSGTGKATANAGAAQAVNGSVTTVASAAALLYPGNTVGLIVNVHNPNSFSVKISAVTLTSGTAPDANGITGAKTPAACTPAASGVTLQTASLTNQSVSVAANGDATVTVPNGVGMAATSDDGCQSASFTFTSGIAVTAAAG